MRSWSARSRRWSYHDAFVFSGGGNAGAAQVGIARALLEAGVEPDLFIGCSVGALNATYLAMDPTVGRLEGLQAIWRTVGTGTIFGGTRRSVASHLVRRDDHLFEADGLRNLIRTSIGVRDLADIGRPVHVVTTDLLAGEPVWWSSGDPVEVLTASACLPGVFPPVRVGRQIHVDGGVLCPVPVHRAVALGARRIWVLDVCSARPPQLSARSSALDVLLTSFSLTRRALQVATAEPARPGQTVTVVAPDLPANLDVRDFSRTTELIALGYDAGVRALALEQTG